MQLFAMLRGMCALQVDPRERHATGFDTSRSSLTGRFSAQALCEVSEGQYGLACEHGHSCCILLARKSRFWRNGAWHTWIDYERFQV